MESELTNGVYDGLGSDHWPGRYNHWRWCFVLLSGHQESPQKVSSATVPKISRR